MLKRHFLIATGTAALMALTSGASFAQSDDQPVKLFISPLSFAFPHFVFMVEQMEDEAELIGNVEIVVADGQLSAPKQVADIESAIVQGVDGIILSPVDADALAGSARMAIENGIP